ncbi:hypothetical protein JYU34_006037 [Plutella xylostella]|uniref:Gustatory receptor n=1 Tax=Plutella xylostella TaxID=51655 RepID=A0ABQ7QUV2_PLUXY|nr:hypothetical protein JYU34_006037 [Plutella xylostella]
MFFLLNKMLKNTFNNSTKSDLGEIFKPMYILLSIVGLFPYSITFNKSKKQFTTEPNSLYFNLLPAVTGATTSCVFFCLHLHHVSQAGLESNLSEAVVTTTNYCTELVLSLLCCVAPYCCSVLRRRAPAAMLNRVAAAWAAAPFHLASTILPQLQHNINISVAAVVFHLIVHTVIIGALNTDLWKKVLLIFSFNFPHFIQCVFVAYLNVMALLIVSVLQNIRETVAVHAKESAALGLRKAMSAPLNVRHLEETYSEAHRALAELNRCYQGPILFTLLQCFHSILSNSHIIYYGIMMQKDFNVLDGIDCGVWIVWQILKIYVLGRAGSLLDIESRRIGEALHDLPVDKLESRTLLEIQHFSTQIRFKKMILTVYGYFPVNSTLLFNMVTAAMMYLLILVQFDIPENNPSQELHG